MATRIAVRARSVALDRRLLGILSIAMARAGIRGRPVSGLRDACDAVKARIVRATGTWGGVGSAVRP